MAEIPYGYCYCGCGQRTRVAAKTSARNGWVKGEPIRYVHGHHARKPVAIGPPRLCECGCGRETNVVMASDPRRGAVRGQRRRFIQGHSSNEGRKLDLTDAWVVCPDSGCWLWQRHIDRGGYGTIGQAYAKGSAHRYLYELYKGPIPEGLPLDHLCRVRHCVNPDHLEPVTNAENCRRGANAVLNPESVRRIRKALGEGVSAKELAYRYGVGWWAIADVRRGHTWGDVC